MLALRTQRCLGNSPLTLRSFLSRHFHSSLSRRRRARAGTAKVKFQVRTMSAGNAKALSGPAARRPGTESKKEVRILMLHGYTQSGPLFRSKIRALEKLVNKTLSPFNLVATYAYPTAPNKLSVADIPGFAPPEVGKEDEEPEAYAWWRKDEASGRYKFFKEGMEGIVGAVQEASQAEGKGLDGVIGFSQGGAVAALMAAALEPGRAVPSREAYGEYDWDWVENLRLANGRKPLGFCVIYSGFWAPPPEVQWLYEPAITTPTLHYLGSLDGVVVESRSTALVDRCIDPVVMRHPGGHYVPVSREWVMPLVGFVKDKMIGAPNGEDQRKQESDDEFGALG